MINSSNYKIILRRKLSSLKWRKLQNLLKGSVRILFIKKGSEKGSMCCDNYIKWNRKKINILIKIYCKHMYNYQKVLLN